MLDRVKSWWHERTDEVEGVNKWIGEPGSGWRQHVVIPAALLLVVLVAFYAVDRDG